ncbi:MAG: hypothetical protein RBG1_1C00001G1673 [candidate division Zixibacteria bacterium RBG-1]|nr:MAG: hypothetical protein RBG1_1C00001G1673 [candidate division Zixibacteria bacterium RBG-1]
MVKKLSETPFTFNTCSFNTLLLFVLFVISMGCSDKPTKSVLFTEAAISPEFPNPVKDSVIIRYALPVYSVVKFRVMNRYGEKVFTLVKYENAGFRSIVWHLQDSEGRRVGSDIYRATFETADFKKEFDIKVE